MAAILMSTTAPAHATTPIQHVIFIIQENRSFDHYFGTYPGADGIPHGTCVPINPAQPNLGCVTPYESPLDVSAGSLHHYSAAVTDIDNGMMDGFIESQLMQEVNVCRKFPKNPTCLGSNTGFVRHDVVAYHTSTELTSYWQYARHFVLQDRMFASSRGYSTPNHLYVASEWSATCTNEQVTSTCASDPNPKGVGKHGTYPWASLFQLLDINNVSWKWYLGEGNEPDCDDGTDDCPPQIQTKTVASSWNPAPEFAWVRAQGKEYIQAHNPTADQFLIDVRNGTLPAVSWVVPCDQYSEHPVEGVTQGMEYVTAMINAVMQSPYWANTAIFITWDDWGGFYDHVVPPNVDSGPGDTTLGYGLRVPGLMISAYAKPNYVDHQLLSFDNYPRLVEDLFINRTRLDPAALGNPDSRPTQRDSLTSVTFPDGHSEPVGRLVDEFNFSQSPLPPLVLNAHIPVGLKIRCRVGPNDNSASCTNKTVVVFWKTLTGPQIPETFTYHVLRDGTELPQCTGTAITCNDIPPSGPHVYTAYSVDPQNVASPVSLGAYAIAK